MATATNPMFPSPAKRLQLEDFGNIVPKWVELSSSELQAPPWRAICSVSVRDGENREHAIGTGWLAGPSTVITAAHVVALPVRGRSNLRALIRFPLENSFVAALDVRRHPDFTGDVTQHFDPYDIAALRLSEPRQFFLNLARPPSSQTVVQIAGFPDQAGGHAVVDQGEMIALESNGSRILLHKVDTDSGHSGAPVFSNSTGTSVIGLHVHGWAGNPYASRLPRHNVALAMTKDLADFVNAHARAWR